MPSEASLRLLDGALVETLLHPDVRPGTHLTCVGADTKGKRELPSGLLERACLFVDDRERSRRIGEGQWAPDHPAVELGEPLPGRAQVTRSASDITVFDMTGLALQDLAVARMLFERAVLSDLGTRVPWSR